MFSSILQELDPITLLPKRVFRYRDINPSFTGDIATAKPARDIRTSDTIGFTMETSAWGGGATYNLWSFSNDDNFDPPGQVLKQIQGKPTLPHMVAITRRYIILVRYPFYAPNSGFSLLGSNSTPDTLKFDCTDYVFFHVIVGQDREKREQICVYRAPAFFALNIVNAFEANEDHILSGVSMSATTSANNCICIDFNAYSDPQILRALELSNLRTANMLTLPSSTVRQYVLGRLSEAAAIYKIKPDDVYEVAANPLNGFYDPLIISEGSLYSPHRLLRRVSLTKPNRYAWGVSVGPESRPTTQQGTIWDSIVKADLLGKTRIEWRCDYCYPSEPIMVPTPGHIDPKPDISPPEIAHATTPTSSTSRSEPATPSMITAFLTPQLASPGSHHPEPSPDSFGKFKGIAVEGGDSDPGPSADPHKPTSFASHGNTFSHEEDSGVLLSVVMDIRSNISFLLFLDAATMTEVGRANVPYVLPLSLHDLEYGAWTTQLTG
ncbi:retinal pigment epithelial membrane protein-domain-containing protein [Cladochytrium replicatum]|nr:retinal pigment epithelial membrane protein-domain-containing protein [Cladochytrium replicatum]